MSETEETPPEVTETTASGPRSNEVINAAARRNFKRTFGSEFLPEVVRSGWYKDWDRKNNPHRPYQSQTWRVSNPERYQIIGLLGSGAKAVVYEATDTKTGELVAAKIIDQSLLGEIPGMPYSIGEGEATAQFDLIDDPRVVAIKEFFVVDSLAEGPKAVIVMEKVAGDYRSLQERIEANDLTSSDAQKVINDLCQFVDDMQARPEKVIHRDLKPGNILYSPKDPIKITDFGYAGSANELKPETFVGTPGYASPEVVTKGQYGYASEIYAAGVTAKAILTGQMVPAMGILSEQDLLPQFRNKVDLKKLNFALTKALAPNPTVRPQTAMEFAKEFEAAFTA